MRDFHPPFNASFPGVLSVSDLTGGLGHPVPLARYDHGTPLPVDLKLPGLGNADSPGGDGSDVDQPTLLGRLLSGVTPPYRLSE